MNLKDKEVLVMGLGISGIWAVKTLHKLGAIITITDRRQGGDLIESLNKIKEIPTKKYLGTDNIDLDNIDLIIKSPGIPPKSKIIKKALDQNISVINDIELGFNLLKSKNIIAITGTNGKTTTTSLV